MVVVIYHYVERIWGILITSNFCIIYMIMKKYYPGEPVNIHVQSLINIIQKNNWVITTKKGQGKFPLFCGNGEQVIPIYGGHGIMHVPYAAIQVTRTFQVVTHAERLFVVRGHHIPPSIISSSMSM